MHAETQKVRYSLNEGPTSAAATTAREASPTATPAIALVGAFGDKFLGPPKASVFLDGWQETACLGGFKLFGGANFRGWFCRPSENQIALAERSVLRFGRI